ncbi:MAG: hypothetical protein IH605_03670 [Burkholderiales bacterium]|nr:hypothetical protein [Burkholderiales bacterium]
MKLPALFIYAFLLSLTPSAAFAQEADADTHFKSLEQNEKERAAAESLMSKLKACKEVYANSNIDPVRDKIAFEGNPATDDMLKNKSKPNTEEKKALRAFIYAEVASEKCLDAIFYRDDENARHALVVERKKEIETNIKPLINGKITYAEYNILQEQRDQRLKEVVEKLVKAVVAQASPQNESKTQLNPADTAALDTWYKHALDTCVSNDECKRIVKKTYDDSIACSGGDSKACSEHDNNLMNIGRWNGGQRAAQATSQDPMMKCLQDTAAQVLTWCRNTDCDTSLVTRVIGVRQRMMCGYSAIQGAQPVPQNPDPTCITNPTAIGGWITTCH